MKQVTRDVDPASMLDLLERARGACLAYAGSQGPVVQPVELLWRAGRYLVNIPQDAGQPPHPGQEVVLLVDEGIYYFDLRAIYVRGQARAAKAPTEAPAAKTPDAGAFAGGAWFEVVPVKTVAWDYGQLREVKDEG